MNVLLLHDRIAQGARPDETDALVQVEAIGAVLREQGHRAEPLAFSLNLAEVADNLSRLAPDLVFNLVESTEGAGRLIYLAPALLDRLGVPYTGASTEAVFLTSNKILTKRLLTLHGIDTPNWVEVGSSDRNGQIRGRSYLIKSIWEDASLGLDDDACVRAEGTAELQRRIAVRANVLGGAAFAEEYIEGREFNLSVLNVNGEPRVLPPAEIVFEYCPPGRLGVVDHAAKWDVDSFAYSHTPRRFDFPDSDVDLLRRMERIALDCWNVLQLSGYARFDFRVDVDGRPWVLEANANPCLSPDAGFVAAAAKSDLSFPQLIRHILEAALRRTHASMHSEENRPSGAICDVAIV